MHCLDEAAVYRVDMANALANNDLDLARQILANARVQFPSAAWVALGAFTLAQRVGDRVGAATHAADARILEPDNEAAWCASCVAERERGCQEVAKALIAESLQRFGISAWMLIEQARIAEQAGHYAEVLSFAQDLQDRFSNHPGGYELAVSAACALGNVADAFKTVESAEALFPEVPWPFALRMSLARWLGRFDEEIALAEAMRHRFPDAEEGYTRGIGALRGSERLYEAQTLAEAAVQRFPNQLHFVQQVTELDKLIFNRTCAHKFSQRLIVARPSFVRPRIVVVLGMHRTGSSLVTRMLGELGVGLGSPLMSGNFANLDGYFEHLEIVATHEIALNKMGVTWDACWSVQPNSPALTPIDYEYIRRRLEQITARELDTNNGIWGFKDPRTVRFLPMWAEIIAYLGADPTYILCMRDPRAVAASLFARDRIPIAISEILWIEHTLEILSQTGSKRPLILHYENWFKDSETQLRELSRALGKSADGVASLASIKMRHQPSATGATMIPLATEIYKALTAPAVDFSDLQTKSIEMLSRLKQLARVGFDHD